MIIGIGTDIVQIPRIIRILNKFGDVFLSRILHPKEYAKIKTLKTQTQAGYLAKRFAAKEALSKAIGSGISGGIRFKDIAIINNDKGKPTVFIEQNIIAKIGLCQIDVSLSDDYPIAIAFVVISK